MNSLQTTGKKQVSNRKIFICATSAALPLRRLIMSAKHNNLHLNLHDNSKKRNHSSYLESSSLSAHAGLARRATLESSVSPETAEIPTATTPRKSVASKVSTVFIVSAGAVTTIFLRSNILLTFTGLRPQKNRSFKFFGEAYRPGGWGRVLDTSLGGEARPGPSYPAPV